MKKILSLKLVIVFEFQNKENIFAKGHVSNWSEEVFIANKTKNAVPWTYAISGLNGEEIAESFYEKKSQKNWSKKY